MHLEPLSNFKEEEMKEQYFDALSPEEMKELTKPVVAQQSDDAERQVQGEETSVEQDISENQFRKNHHIIGEVIPCKEEDEDQYFDAISPDEINGKKKSNNLSLKENVAKRNVGKELEDGEYEESTADIWIPPNERNGHLFYLRKAESQDDSDISKVLRVGDEKTIDFETFLSRETYSEEVNFTLNEQRRELEQQSNDTESQDLSVAMGILQNQQGRNSFDPNMSESQCEMQNPNTLSIGELGAIEEERNSFNHMITESQDDTDNPEHSSSGEEEERYLEKAISSTACETLQMYGLGTKLPVGMEPDYSERKQTKQQPYIINVKIHASVLKYQNLPRCRQEKGMVIEAEWNISFDLTKSGNSANSFWVCGGYILRRNENGMVIEAPWIISFDLATSGNSASFIQTFFEFVDEFMPQADQLENKSVTFVDVERRRLTYAAIHCLNFMSQKVGKYSTNNPKCSMQLTYLIYDPPGIKSNMLKGCEKNLILGGPNRVRTYNERVGKLQAYTKSSNLKGRNVLETDNDTTLDIRCTEMNTETLSKYPDGTNGAKKDNSNETSEEKPRLFPFEDLRKNSSDTKKENRTPDELDKVHHALDQKQFETAIDRTIDKTQKEYLREEDNKIKDRVNNMPGVSQKKQSLNEDTKLKFGAKHQNIREKKAFGIRGNLFSAPLFPWMLLFFIHPLMATGPDKICKETIQKVSRCPTATEHQQIALGKCTGVCGDSELKFEYHCVRDSTKTFLVELCAVPFYLYDNCVEYDEVSHIIQMDQFSLCNSPSKQRYSLSSNVFLCDPDSCLRILTRTTNQNTSKTDSTNTTNTYEREQSGIMLYVPVIVGTPVLLIIITIIAIKKSKGTSENHRDNNDQLDPLNEDNPTSNLTNTSRLTEIVRKKFLWDKNRFQAGHSQEV